MLVLIPVGVTVIVGLAAAVGLSVTAGLNLESGSGTGGYAGGPAGRWARATGLGWEKS